MAGLSAAANDKGEVCRFPGIRGKLRVATAMLKGDLAALRMMPRFFRKRREIEKIRKLTPKQVKDLLLRHRISLKELNEQAV